MSTRARLIALVAAGALLVGCGGTTAGVGVLGSPAGAPPAVTDQGDSGADDGAQEPTVAAPDDGGSEDSGDALAPTSAPEDNGGSDTGGEDTGGEDTGGDDSGGDTGGDGSGGEDTGGGADVPAVPGMPENLDACMNVSLAYLSIAFGAFATEQSELDQILVDVDTALASAPEDIKPALQTLADLSRQAQGKPVEEWSAILGSPEYTAASDEVSQWLSSACGS